MARILVTNDDGVDAPGLRHLAEALKRVGEVTWWRQTESRAPRDTR